MPADAKLFENELDRAGGPSAGPSQTSRPEPAPIQPETGASGWTSSTNRPEVPVNLSAGPIPEPTHLSGNKPKVSQTLSDNQQNGHALVSSDAGLTHMTMNEGTYQSVCDTGPENLGINRAHMYIHASQGTHVVENNAGVIHVNDLKSGSYVHIGQQQGTIHLALPGSWLNGYRPHTVTYHPTGGPVTLNHNGLITPRNVNLSSDLQQRRLTTVSSGVGTVVQTVLSPAVAINNSGAIPASLAASQNAVRR